VQLGNHYYSMCFDCDKFIRGKVIKCQYCNTSLHGELGSHYYGTSDDPKIIEEWAEKLKVLNKEQKLKREEEWQKNRKKDFSTLEFKFYDLIFFTLCSIIAIMLVWVAIASVIDEFKLFL